MRLDGLERDYQAALTGYVLQRTEGPLRVGYELGRAAVSDGVNLLALSRIHHEAFRTLLAQTRPDQTDDLVEATSAFFLEVLSTFHMTHPLADPQRFGRGDSAGRSPA